MTETPTRGRRLQPGALHSSQAAMGRGHVVVFDTVKKNAGSHCWPLEEWERLINVAASRAAKLFSCLRHAMRQAKPFCAVVEHLWPCAFAYSGRAWDGRGGCRETRRPPHVVSPAAFRPGLGAQLARRKALRPSPAPSSTTLPASRGTASPGGRGVAGRGRTRVLERLPSSTCRNAKQPGSSGRLRQLLGGLIHRLHQDAWAKSAKKRPGRTSWANPTFPQRQSLASFGNRWSAEAMAFEYDLRSTSAARKHHSHAAMRRLFIDEAQDIGPATIALDTVDEQATRTIRRARRQHLSTIGANV